MNWSFLSILNYLGKFSPATAEVCEPLQKLTLVKADWMWSRIYQDLHDRAKKILMKDACMKFYDASRPLHLEIDASGVGLGDGLLQVKDGMNCRCDEVLENTTMHPNAFTSKSPSGAE